MRGKQENAFIQRAEARQSGEVRHNDGKKDNGSQTIETVKKKAGGVVCYWQMGTTKQQGSGGSRVWRGGNPSVSAQEREGGKGDRA